MSELLAFARLGLAHITEVAVPLFGFNLGLEAGQVVVLAAATLALAGIDRAIDATRPTLSEHSLRFRTKFVSAGVAIIALRWAVERSPW
jgi:hypothetical protein